jgi:hypothetical protein
MARSPNEKKRVIALNQTKRRFPSSREEAKNDPINNVIINRQHVTKKNSIIIKNSKNSKKLHLNKKI